MTGVKRLFRIFQSKEDSKVKPKKALTLNPVLWYVFLTLVAFMLSILITVFLWIMLAIGNMFIEPEKVFSLSGNIMLGVWAVTFIILILPESNGGFVVPGTRYAVLVTWLGMPLSLVLTSGEYKWTGSRFGFGRTTVVFGPNNGDFTDENGFAKAGPITFAVWNTANSKEKNHTIVAPAHNRANIYATLTLILQIVDFRTLFDQDDPARDIGDRARQEFREFVNSFVDTDIPSLVHIATNVLNGEELYSFFIQDSVDVYKAGSMIRDRGGRAMFKIMPPKPKDHSMLAQWEADRKERIDAFTKEVLENAKPKMLNNILIKDENTGEQTLKAKRICVENPIIEVIHAVGMELIRTTMADVVFSDPVIAAANQASAESDERASQMASAKTNKDARKQMLPDEEELKNPAWETAMLIQAAQDDKNGAIKIVVVPGGDKLTKAAIAGGSQIGGK